jgi:GNAT superfamily N-acetyltransferase
MDAAAPPTPTTIRQANAADKPEILSLLREMAPRLDPVTRWTWLYEGNPEGQALTWVAADEQAGVLAGVTSYFPLRVWIEGEVVRGALGGDGYVRPSYRRRGIAGALHAALRAEMPRHRIEVMFGAPAGANVNPLQSGGSRVVSDMVRYLRPLRLRALSPRAAIADPLARLLLRPRGGSARLDPIREGDPRVDEVWGRTRGELHIATVRDATYYAWRFLRAPAGVQHAYVVIDRGVPIGLCALQDMGDRLHIVDVCAPRAAWGAVLGAIARHAGQSATTDALELPLLREDGQARRLWRYGFLPREGRPYLIVTPEGSRRLDVLGDPRRWTYMGGDSDVDRFD